MGVPADGTGELLAETSPRSRVEGESPGNGWMELRGVAGVDVPRERLTTWWGQSRPSPKSRGVQSLARGSGVGSACPVSYSTLCAVGWGRSSPSQDLWDPPFPAPHYGAAPLSHPSSTQHQGGTGVKSCPNLFLAVLQLGINGPGLAVGKCLLRRARPLCSVACVKVSTAKLHFSGIL